MVEAMALKVVFGDGQFTQNPVLSYSEEEG